MGHGKSRNNAVSQHFGRQSKEGPKFKASLRYTVRPYLKQRKGDVWRYLKYVYVHVYAHM
jgi:hypothetical protein